MGSFSRASAIVAVAMVCLVAGVLAVVASSDGGDVIASPTTFDDGPDALALVEPDADAADFVGDDATWLPDVTSSPVGADEISPRESASSDSSATTSTVPNTAVTQASGFESSPTSTPSAPATTAVPTTAVPTTAATTTLPAPTTTAAPTTAAPTTAPPTTAATERAATVGFAGIEVADFTNSNANISQTGQDGSFRTVCTVSHFNSDDAIVFPGQRDATHLHMYFGNTLADFSSTGASLMSSGDATCQGGPLNRSAYWVPAVFDQNGNVRPAQYMLAYYKRAGDQDVVPYPNGLEMVVGNAMAMTTQPGREQPVGAGIDYTWSCGSPITVGKHDAGRLIPNCAPGEFLTLSLIFPRCGDGRLTSPDNKSHMAYPPRYGAACPASHPIRHPQLTYNIHWNNNDTNTSGWYLSSDDHRSMGGSLMAGGTTTHADWIGAWHPEVLEIMTEGCFNADHDCKGGTISPSLRLDSPNLQGHSPANIYDSNASPVILPPPD